MKGLCIESGNGTAKFNFDNQTPVAGRYYALEDIQHGSNRQNSLFHSLRTVFYNYMFETNTFMIEDNGIIYDLRCNSLDGFKELLKAMYGQGRTFKYSDKDHQLIEVSNFEDIPGYVIDDFNNGNKKRINQKIYPWHKYSMPQRHKLITKVFFLMDLFGVDSHKYEDIKQGLIDIDNERKAVEKRKRDERKQR